MSVQSSANAAPASAYPPTPTADYSPSPSAPGSSSPVASYPAAFPQAYPPTPVLTPSGKSAQNYLLAGLICEVILSPILIAFGIIAWNLGLAAGVAVGAGGFGFIFLLPVYLFCYEPTSRGQYAKAKMPTLIFGFLTFLLAGFIPGILYWGAYDKLVRAVKEQAAPYGTPTTYPAPYGTQSAYPVPGSVPVPSVPPYVGPPAPPPPPPPTCPLCHGALTFIPQYQRLYCFNCRQYA